ncbi:MAG: TetR/AcrR family transcriptional regulator [Nitrosomonadaceae bacterium]
MPKVIDHDEERQKLVITAAQHIADNGVLGFTLRDLARAHGVTKGHIQHYFSCKEVLLLGTVDYIETRFIKLMESNITDSFELTQYRLSQMLPMDKERSDLWRVKLAFSIFARDSVDIHKSILYWYQREHQVGTRLFRKAESKYCFHKDFNPGEAYRSLIVLVYGFGFTKNINPKLLPPSYQQSILNKAIDDLLL